MLMPYNPLRRNKNFFTFVINYVFISTCYLLHIIFIGTNNFNRLIQDLDPHNYEESWA